MPAVKKKIAEVDWQEVRDRLSRAALASDEAQRLTPQRIQADLEERARAVARVADQAPPAGALLEVVCFTLGNERYAVETRYVRVVLRPKEITPLPGTPEFLVGIANLRGQILAVLDLRPFFGIEAGADTALARVIVLGQARIEFGVLADAVHEVALLRLEDVKEPPGSVAGVARAYLRGVTADALILLDGAVLLHDPRLYIDLNDGGTAGAAEVKS